MLINLAKLMLNADKFRQGKFKDMEGIFEMLSRGQYPHTLFITCSDSRIMPGLFMGTGPGDMFVVRNVGNNIPPCTAEVSSEASAIEYALEVLNIKNIILCGHSDCGAMKGLLNPNLEAQLPKVAAWLSHSAEVLKKIKNPQNAKLEDVIKLNILTQIDHLKTYTIVAEKIDSGELSIHGWFYKFETGEIFVYHESQHDFIKMELALKYTIEERVNQIVKQVVAEYVAQSLPSTSFAVIWKNLKPLIFEKLWAEIGELYPSPSDHKFQALIESAEKLTLSTLNASLQKVPLYGGIFTPRLSQANLQENTTHLSQANLQENLLGIRSRL